MRTAYNLIAVVALVICAGCGSKKNDVPEAVAPAVFVPSPDSSLSAVQVQRWQSVNPMLDSLSIAYQDSFKTTDPSARTSAQKSFLSAQDALCKSGGLIGGFAEYQYVTVCLPHPRNATLRDSLGVKMLP